MVGKVYFVETCQRWTGKRLFFYCLIFDLTNPKYKGEELPLNNIRRCVFFFFTKDSADLKFYAKVGASRAKEFRLWRCFNLRLWTDFSSSEVFSSYIAFFFTCCNYLPSECSFSYLVSNSVSEKTRTGNSKNQEVRSVHAQSLFCSYIRLIFFLIASSGCLSDFNQRWNRIKLSSNNGNKS